MAPGFQSNFSIRNILSDTNVDFDNIRTTASSSGTTATARIYQASDPAGAGRSSTSSGSSIRNMPSDVKPPYTYTALTVMAIKSSPEKRLTLRGICDWIANNFCYYQKNKHVWQNSLRHNLSLNACFVRVPRALDDPGRGHYWALHPLAENLGIGANTTRLMRRTNTTIYRPIPVRPFQARVGLHCAGPSQPNPLQQQLLEAQQLAWYNQQQQQQQQWMRSNYYHQYFLQYPRRGDGGGAST